MYHTTELTVSEYQLSNWADRAQQTILRQLADGVRSQVQPHLTCSIPEQNKESTDLIPVRLITTRYIFMPEQQWLSIRGTLKMIAEQLPMEHRHYIDDIIHDIEE